MKKIVLLLGLSLFANYLLAQLETISVSIPRDDYSNFSIINSNNDTIFLTLDNDDRILKTDLTYKIVRGKGRTKDYKGDRERNKQYLINSKHDTILTLRESQEIIEFKDLTCIFRERTPNGWRFLDSNNTTVCEMNLLWNDAVWFYELKYYKSNQNIEDLKKVNMLNLVRLAYYRSQCHCECEDDYEDDFWFIMWLTSILD